MVVTIWDTDWCYNKESFPNIYCMKLSSYHQQLGDTINFVRDEVDTTLACDKRYIFRENEDKTEEMNDIITALSSVLSMEEIKIMEESAIAAYVMRKNVEAGKIERNDINENTNTNSIANVFGNINTNTVQ